MSQSDVTSLKVKVSCSDVKLPVHGIIKQKQKQFVNSKGFVQYQKKKVPNLFHRKVMLSPFLACVATYNSEQKSFQDGLLVFEQKVKIWQNVRYAFEMY